MDCPIARLRDGLAGPDDDSDWRLQRHGYTRPVLVARSSGKCALMVKAVPLSGQSGPVQTRLRQTRGSIGRLIAGRSPEPIRKSNYSRDRRRSAKDALSRMACPRSVRADLWLCNTARWRRLPNRVTR